tara:strand:- start:204 stop:653 length:450 start_codon:yes stop_codon:yes gene_type:complete
MEKLITLFLTLALTQSLQSANLEGELNLNFAIPFNYEQIKEDGQRIQQYKESQRIHFKETDNKHIYDWVAWNVLDVYTTNRAITGGYARELNPLLPDFPSLERLIAQKLIVNYALYKVGFFEKPETVHEINKLGWIIVGNNIWIIVDNE